MEIEKLLEETNGLELQAKAELIIDDELKYGNNVKTLYWELDDKLTDEIMAEERLELLAKNWKVGTKLFVFVPLSKQTA